MMLSYKALFICEAFLFSFWGRLSKKKLFKNCAPSTPPGFEYLFYFFLHPSFEKPEKVAADMYVDQPRH